MFCRKDKYYGTECRKFIYEKGNMHCELCEEEDEIITYFIKICEMLDDVRNQEIIKKLRNQCHWLFVVFEG